MTEILPQDDVLALDGAELNKAIARQLGYRQGKDLSRPDQADDWFAMPAGSSHYQSLPPDATQFATNTSLTLSLPLPAPTECCEDWIHIEMGPNGRWIVRLIRFYRAQASQPWKSKELFIADRDDDPMPLATAYGRAWLFSEATWPAEQRSRVTARGHAANKTAA